MTVVAEACGRGQGASSAVKKGYKETLRDDVYAHYCDYGESFVGIYVYQNVSDWTIYVLFIVSQVTSFKLFKSVMCI